MYEKTEWDPLEVEHYSERDIPLAALRDAIAQLTIANTHVQGAYAQLYEVTQRYAQRATDVHTQVHLLRLTPLSTLIPHLRHVLPGENGMVKARRTQRLVLIADDSTVLRKSLTQTLEHAHYVTSEARDGLEALDLLTQNPPDVFLLDMEMPNLNGYDLLSIIHIYPELSDVKIIMLTSRTNEKYKQRALELGAHAYLTKPCPQDVLLATIEKVSQ